MIYWHTHSVIYPSFKLHFLLFLSIYFPTWPFLPLFDFPFIASEKLLPLLLIANQDFMLTKPSQLIQLQRVSDCAVLNHKLNSYVTSLL